MTVAIVRYNAGNICSVASALKRLGTPFAVTDDPTELLAASRVIFPGVGEAGSAMQYLQVRGLDTVLRKVRSPLLGICLGMQLLGEHTEESNTAGLGLIPMRVKRFTKPKKVPHIGWSAVTTTKHPVFEGIPDGAYFYFVHSFRAELSAECIGSCSYEERFAAAVAYRNFIGVQFHPERSGENGTQLLRNFLKWSGV